MVNIRLSCVVIMRERTVTRIAILRAFTLDLILTNQIVDGVYKIEIYGNASVD